MPNNVIVALLAKVILFQWAPDLVLSRFSAGFFFEKSVNPQLNSTIRFTATDCRLLALNRDVNICFFGKNVTYH
jgi:hypothetical protein